MAGFPVGINWDFNLREFATRSRSDFPARGPRLWNSWVFLDAHLCPSTGFPRASDCARGGSLSSSHPPSSPGSSFINSFLLAPRSGGDPLVFQNKYKSTVDRASVAALNPPPSPLRPNGKHLLPLGSSRVFTCTDKSQIRPRFSFGFPSSDIFEPPCRRKQAVGSQKD
ncbi:Hypothetical predicted protein [Podarcis lilfordi]|uniref:Uncharacterized protein n=1 Tax=Podarcis lilfordi TaxID=74358 RepID=A0AA35KXM0_9SAUR|nr:Hypothetical predicted protein [Podarcis lilfordi]